MATRDFIKHVVSTSEPRGLALGDEYYNPSTNKLFKNLAVSGTSVRFQEQQPAIAFQASGSTVTTAPSAVNFPGATLTFDSATGVLSVAASGVPGGSNTQIQFNNSGAFGGSSNLTWNNSTQTLTITGFASANQVRALGGLNATAWTTTGPIFNISGSLTDVSGSGGTVAIRAASSFNSSTFAASVSTTVSNAVTLLIEAPTAGTNTTITNPWGIWNSSNSYLGGTSLLGAQSANYVQVTGAASANTPIISAQGSDSNISIGLQGKGTGSAVLLASDGSVCIRAILRTASGDTWIDVRRDVGFVDLIAASGVTNGDIRLTTKGTGALRVNTGGGEQFRVTDTASAVNYVQVTGAPVGNTPSISAAGSDTHINLNYFSKGIGGHSFYTSGTGLQFAITHSPSAVNYVQVTGGATGGNVAISAQGLDSNVGIQLRSRGTGDVRFITGGSEQARISNTASAVNYVQVTGAATGSSPAITTQGSDTNAGLTIAAKGVNPVLINSLWSLAVTTAATAAGTNQGTATLITTPITNVTTVAASTGVRLPDTAPLGMRIVIRNSGANNLNVYPQTGGAINALGANVAFVAEVSTNLEFVAVSTTQWYTLNATFA